VQSVPSDDAVTPSNESKVSVKDMVDFNVFDNIQSGDHCDGDHPQNCKALDRIVSALNYHQFLIVNPLNEKYGDDPKAAFVDFCDRLYSKRKLLNDYIHFQEHHSDTKTIEYLRDRLFMKCESARKCGATSRHYRDRGDGANGGDETESSWCIDRIDALHFAVNHLTELGLRTSLSEVEEENDANGGNEEDSDSVDVAMKRLAEVIKAKREVLSNERLDGTVNSKFTLQVEEVKESGNDGMFT